MTLNFLLTGASARPTLMRPWERLIEPGASSSEGSGYPWVWKGGECIMILQLHKHQLSPQLFQLEFVGKLLMGNDSRQVEWGLSELLVAGIKKVIFDLAMLDAIDSTGVGIIVMCHAKLQKVGGSLRIGGAQGIVLETLQMTHVDRLMPFFATSKEAAQDFVAA